jgi:hypothetical protein
MRAVVMPEFRVRETSGTRIAELPLRPVSLGSSSPCYRNPAGMTGDRGAVMLTLFWTGALLSAYLGYKLRDWWMPAAVAGAALAGQFALFQMAAGSWGPSAQMLGYGLMNLVMFYATFGIGRSLGQRRRQWRKGVR